MPLLGPESLPGSMSKFVRNGNVIAFDEPDKPHAAIAKEFKLGEPSGFILAGIEEMIIDDAGTVSRRGEVLCFSSLSSTCELREDDLAVREQTVQVAQAITGMQAKSQ